MKKKQDNILDITKISNARSYDAYSIISKTHSGHLSDIEMKAAIGVASIALTDIIYSLGHSGKARDISVFLLGAMAIERTIFDNKDSDFRFPKQTNMVNHAYNDLFDVLRGDEEKVIRGMRWKKTRSPTRWQDMEEEVKAKPEILTDKIKAVSEIAEKTIRYSLDRLKKDLDKFQEERREIYTITEDTSSWTERVGGLKTPSPDSKSVDYESKISGR